MSSQELIKKQIKNWNRDEQRGYQVLEKGRHIRKN